MAEASRQYSGCKSRRYLWYRSIFHMTWKGYYAGSSRRRSTAGSRWGCLSAWLCVWNCRDVLWSTGRVRVCMYSPLCRKAQAKLCVRSWMQKLTEEERCCYPLGGAWMLRGEISWLFDRSNSLLNGWSDQSETFHEIFTVPSESLWKQ